MVSFSLRRDVYKRQQRTDFRPESKQFVAQIVVKGVDSNPSLEHNSLFSNPVPEYNMRNPPEFPRERHRPTFSRALKSKSASSITHPRERRYLNET